MNLRNFLSRILDLLKSSVSEEIGRSVQTMLERINEPSVSPEDRKAAVTRLIQTQESTLEELYDALQHIESDQINLTNEVRSNPEAKAEVQSLLREVSRLAQNRADSIKALSQRSRMLLLEARSINPDSGFFTASLQTLSTAVPSWAKKYKALSKRINKLEIYFALKLGFEELEQRQKRQSNLEEIKDLGVDPYPHKFERTHTVTQLAQVFESTFSHELEEGRSHVAVAARIQAINNMGKTGFIRITDGTTVFQIYLKSSEVNPGTWSLFRLLDLGDLIGTEGSLFRTNTGEPSIKAKSITFLAKALSPPPDKYYGLHDIELRYRQRYADLIASREVRRVFETRSQIIRSIRRYFDDRGYVEVETPMMTSLPTGAVARPFKTHHNALDIDLYARIAPELYLKRLIVGGFEKVYEINRNFRNEGIDRSHNPEFTMLEWYEAYSEYEDLLKLTEELISILVEQVCAKAVIDYGENQIDFTRPWKRLTMREAVIHYWPDSNDKPAIEDLSARDSMLRWAQKIPDLNSQISHLSSLDYGHLLGEIFEHVAEAQLINPIFITEFPVELSPLSKQNQDDPRFVDRFELYIASMEIANAFCEINDPVDQRQRFEAQMKLRERGDDEAMVIDEDYIRALSYGMPPTAGEGVGIDRLVMILTNQHSIRDVILFPHMRPESK